MRPGSDLDDFEDYFDHRFRTLRRTAYALTGSWEQAEELTQDTFARLYRHWPRGAGIDAYARRTLTNLFLDRRQYKAEIPRPTCPSVRRPSSRSRISRRHVTTTADRSAPLMC